MKSLIVLLFSGFITSLFAQSPLWNGIGHSPYNQNMVVGWYRNYLNRNPQPQELTFLQSEYARGRSHQEIQGYLLGSDEYFNNKCGRSVERFVAELFADMYQRGPTANESRYWVNKLRDYEMDRVKFSRDFVRQINGGVGNPLPGTPITPPIGNFPPSDIPYGDPRALTSQMHAVSHQIVNTIQLELGSSFQGRKLMMHANNLKWASERLASAATQYPPGTPQFNSFLDPVSRAFRAFQSEMIEVSGVCYSLNQLSNRYMQLLAALTGNALPTPPVTPPGSNYPPSAARDVFQQSTLLSSSMQRLAMALQSPLPVPYDRVSPSSLARDAYALSTSSGELATMASQGYPVSQLAVSYRGIRNQARILDQNLKLMGRLPFAVQMAWSDSESALVRLSSLLLMNEPVNPSPLPPIGGGNAGNIITMIDSNLAELDGFMTSVAPLSWTVPGMPRFIAECQELRTNLLALRRAYLLNSSPVDIQLAHQQVAQGYLRVNTLWRTIQNNPGYSLPDMGRFNQSMESLNALPK